MALETRAIFRRPGAVAKSVVREHALSIPPSHHRATLSLRRADVRSAGGYNVGYNEYSCTTNFATAPGRLYIAYVSDDMVPPPGN